MQQPMFTPTPQETLVGTVERVTFYNPDSGYGVIKIRARGHYPRAQARDGTITVVGTMPELGAGETVRCLGSWIDDPRYGRQFRIDSIAAEAPTTDEGLIAYLSSGVVKGIGKETARRIVDYFGAARLIDILDNEPARLDEINTIGHEGIRPRLLDNLRSSWRENVIVRSAMIFLQGHGVGPGMARRIIDHYGAATVARVQEDPYALADEVNGIGFLRADKIASALSIPLDSPQRLRAGLHYVLNQFMKDGHVYAPRAELIARSLEILRVDNPARLEAVLSSELLHGNLYAETSLEGISEDAIYLPANYHAEKGAAARLKRLVKARSPIINAAKKTQWPDFLAELSAANDIDLTEQQQGAVKQALLHKVSVLTGGPGTGKTTTLRMVIAALDKLGFTVSLASPTGRAAKRLAEATGRQAQTIHRLLGYSPGEGFTYDEDNPLKLDMLIVDEASMIDLHLFEDLLRALPPEAHLLLVGDVDQLPSVGAGNVLRDVIDSGLVEVTRLDVIFRQREDSHIIINAHRINRGELPLMDNESSDFFFFNAEDAADTAELLVDIVTRRLVTRFGFDPMRDIQVIAPMYRGPAGVHALNEALQRAINPESGRTAKKLIGDRVFRVGDKLMQTRNNYEKDVFNGDIGYLNAIDFESGEFEVVIDGEYRYYSYAEVDELIHAYCISTHRSQGSEYPVVVMPVLTQHYMMLQRNLLYTAVTRAKKLVVLVGSRRAVAMAVTNNKVAERYSGLLARLRG
ncbi:MAG: SF1B family DNA helicase RecD2 [Candidatus Flexifilum sp.]